MSPVLPCFELNYKFLKWHKKTSFARDDEKTRKSSEHGPENGKPKFNQTKRRSDNGGSARVDCHIYKRRNKYLQYDMAPENRKKSTPLAIVLNRGT